MRKPITLILFFYTVIATLTIVFFSGTGDAGDSILHYLFAKYVPVHPELFFNPWAKPVYVLLAFPFAQFGFTGIKIFNALVTFCTIYLTYRTAVVMELKNAALTAVILICMPLYYILTFSGLTEPLFALGVAGCLYLAVTGKYMAASLLVSFMPFVRSEGLIIIGVFLLFFLQQRQWRVIPALLAGSIVYSLAGYPVHDDLFWVFTRIPYARLSSTYGSGELFHFVDQLYYVIGLPVYFLFFTGYLALLAGALTRKFHPEQHILVFLGFSGFFIAHSLFWYLGIFNSMGLKRVLLCVAPLIALISLYGYNLLTEVKLFERKKWTGRIIKGFLVLYILVFPVTSNPAAIQWKRDMMPGKDQKLALECMRFMEGKWNENTRFLFSHPYLSEVLDIDWFDPAKRVELNSDHIKRIKATDIIIWESWFAVVESNVHKSDLDNHPGLKRIFEVSDNDHGHEIQYAVYQAID